MIEDVTFERTIYQAPPRKFEAGTGSIADAVGLGAAIDYVSAIGMENIAAYEHDLLEYGIRELRSIPGLTLIGAADQRAGVLSFVLDGHGNEYVAKYLDETAGIAVRAGHHCAQPIHRRFGLEGTVRPSLAFYNSPEEIELLARTLRTLVKR
jgi:cysteine desulfurase/selenocysteine lyase